MKNPVGQRHVVLRSANGKRDSRYPAGDAPTDYFIDFTEMAPENPLSDGGVWTNAAAGTGGNSPISLNVSMQVRASADDSTVICCEGSATNDYDDSVSFVPGFPNSQRVVATIYKAAGYSPPTTNHEMEIFLGCESMPGGGKRGVEIGFNYAGGYFIVGFNGSLTSWQDPPPAENMSSPWYDASTGLGVAPANDDVFTAELNRTAKTIKCWQNSTLVINLQWNDTTIVTSAAQAVLNDLGDGAGLGALRRVGGDATPGAFGWSNFLLSHTLSGV